MEKLTIAKLGQEKVINYTNKKTNRPDSFNKVGFQSNEKPEVWIDFTYRGACPLVVGNQYDFEVTPREYNGKTYYDAKLPRTEKSAPDVNRVELKCDAILKLLTTMAHEQTSIKTVLGEILQKIDPVVDDPTFP